jgi:hypothetical protein
MVPQRVDRGISDLIQDEVDKMRVAGDQLDE